MTYEVVTRYGVPVMRKSFGDFARARAFMIQLRIKRRWDGLTIQARAA